MCKCLCVHMCVHVCVSTCAFASSAKMTEWVNVVNKCNCKCKCNKNALSKNVGICWWNPWARTSHPMLVESLGNAPNANVGRPHRWAVDMTCHLAFGTAQQCPALSKLRLRGGIEYNHETYC